MTTPKPPLTDAEVASRLHASWEHAVAHAEDDLATGELVATALARARRRPPARTAWAITTVAALALVAGAAVIVGGTNRADDAVTPSGSPGPAGTSEPVDDGGMPILEPGETFPATVGGHPVIAVTPGSVDRIASTPDATPVYVSGWLLGDQPRICPGQFGSGTVVPPGGVLFDDCLATALHESADGGATLLVHWTVGRLHDSQMAFPAKTEVMPVLLELHVHDAACAASDCAAKAVFDRVVQYGKNRFSSTIVAATMPPGGITRDEAVAAALAFDKTSMDPGSLTIMSVEAGPAALLSDQASGDDTTWIWLVRFVTPDGYRTVDVWVDYLDGSTNHASGGDIPFP